MSRNFRMWNNLEVYWTCVIVARKPFKNVTAAQVNWSGHTFRESFKSDKSKKPNTAKRAIIGIVAKKYEYIKGILSFLRFKNTNEVLIAFFLSRFWSQNTLHILAWTDKNSPKSIPLVNNQSQRSCKLQYYVSLLAFLFVWQVKNLHSSCSQ